MPASGRGSRLLQAGGATTKPARQTPFGHKDGANLAFGNDHVLAAGDGTQSRHCLYPDRIAALDEVYRRDHTLGLGTC